MGAITFLVIAIVRRLGARANQQLPPNPTDDDILKMALQGRKILAIKWYRELHGVGLKDAKVAVERMLEKS